MQQYFYDLADHLTSLLQGEEVYTAKFAGEASDFVRFNQGAVRQAGHVIQRGIGIDLILGRRHAGASTTLSGDSAEDLARLSTLVASLRAKLALLPEDPYLLYATDVQSSERHAASELPAPERSVERIREAAAGRDLVGLYAAGGVGSGFANSLGQRNWYETNSFNLDWSFYHHADKAVKADYAGFEWNDAAFERKVATAVDQLGALSRAPLTVDPGEYRVYLAPAAVNDIVGLLGWGGFGLKSHRTRQTPLLKMTTGEASLAPGVTIRENTAEGVAANFQSSGFIRPDAVTLIEGGAYRECLVSPRSAKEYGVPTNGASGSESPESLDLGAGTLPTSAAVERLGRGLYVGNVHYLNYSDRSSCRTTGMTRFATFWVEGGEIQAPINVMRFDETVYRVLGQNLVDLTAEREFLLDSGTYGGRSTVSGRMPGALVEDFRFTL
ncbi:MAG: metallopeptidase TldD-related protein [Planctomycetota bacterium]|nr:metallopeptidase TldD-related protein [Planctomycetota bacterium]